MKPATPLDPHRAIDAATVRPLPSARARAQQYLVRTMGLAAARLLRPSALLDESVRSAFWRAGTAVQPKGFYASMVDPGDLPVPPGPAIYEGIDFNDRLQQHYLSDVFPRFQQEYLQLPHLKPADWTAKPSFFLENDAFTGIDALAYWAIVRFHRPKRIVEIGSGHSTLLGVQALGKNDDGRLVAVDPYPRQFIRKTRARLELMPKQVQDIPIHVFTSLEQDDILFIDGSHLVRTGGDTNFLFLEVLPRLAPGVLVHVHDIYFPCDYPRHLIADRNVYWTEQYLLQAYLIGNGSIEVVFGSRYCAYLFREQTRRAFPGDERLIGASFWIRTKARR